MSEPKVTRRKITDYVPDPHNANKGTQRGQYMVDTSIEQVGAARSIVAAADGTIPAGNKTLQAAADAGIEDVIEVETDGRQLVVVKRKDWATVDDPAARKYAYLDNRASEVGLAWDAEVMQADFDAGFDFAPMFNEVELANIGLVTSEPPADPGPQIDRAAELLEVWQVERGQVWEIESKATLGKCHRVMCGDSTSADDVARLMAGDEPRLMVTDPPYGVEYEASWRNDLFGDSNRATGKVANDEQVDWSDAYLLSPADVVYCWHADRHASNVESGLKSAGFEIRCQIIWAKPHFVVGRGHYSTRHEPCWYCVRKGATSQWRGASNEQTIWNIDLDDRVVGGHSTQKPLECMERPISNHDGDIYDPFLGTGTTIVAAERQRRIGYGMEIAPEYVSVTLQRLADMGLTVRLADGAVPEVNEINEGVASG